MGIFPPTDQPVRFDGALEQRPALAALIGRIVADWANAEMLLAIAFAILLQVDARIAFRILDAIYAKDQKFRQITAVAYAKITNQDLVARMQLALRGLKEAGKLRDRVAHGRWGISGAYPNVLLWIRSTAGEDGFEVYDEPKLHSIIDLIAESAAALHKVTIETGQELGSIPSF